MVKRGVFFRQVQNKLEVSPSPREVRDYMRSSDMVTMLSSIYNIEGAFGLS